MNKLTVFIGSCLLSLETLAQPRIEWSIHPSFDAPATVQLQTGSQNQLQLIFNQRGEQRPVGTFSWSDDTTKIVHVRKMGRYFQRFAFSDTINVTQPEAPVLFRAYREVLTQARALATSKDDRWLIDGLTCTLTVFTNAHISYNLKYSSPAYEGNRSVSHLLQAMLMSLKMKSKNPATVNYCMIADVYLR